MRYVNSFNAVKEICYENVVEGYEYIFKQDKKDSITIVKKEITNISKKD